MRMPKSLIAISCALTLSITGAALAAGKSPGHQPRHFQKIMVVMFENMSYAEIKNEPTFKKLVEYTGNTLDANGRLVRLLKAPSLDSLNNGYAFFSSYYNNHDGGNVPSRPSQPNYIAMTSGSIHGIHDNDMHDLAVDNLGMELKEANINWKVYAEDLPDPSAAAATVSDNGNQYQNDIKPFVRDPNKSEQENDLAEQKYLEANRKFKSAAEGNGCFAGSSHVEGPGNDDDGYMRKHEPFISYLNIQKEHASCARIVNASHLAEDVESSMPDVSFYIPNQVNDGHNGTLEERVVRANAFLSRMMGTDPRTGEPLPDAAKKPFQKFLSQGGLLVITFDEPSVTGDPDQTLYTLLAGKMLNSGAYPDRSGEKQPVCYPAVNDQRKYPQDENGTYEPTHCNHYNLLRMIEQNWNLRGLKPVNTSAGYKYAYALDNGVPGMWK